MTHLTMEELLRVRAAGVEPGDSALRAHADECPLCRAELDRLHQRVARLKALPALRPARDRWPAVRAQLESDRRRRRLRAMSLGGLALAASLALAYLAPRPEPLLPPAAAADELTQTMEHSRALENALMQWNPEARVLDGRTAQVAQQLEDRIAVVDRQLEMVGLLEPRREEARLLELWRERVGLLDALVDVHLTRASKVGL